MPKKQETVEDVPFYISCSETTTEANKTGSWRFVRPSYDEKTAPCSAACPAGEDIGRIEMLASHKGYAKAWQTILEENPFPAVCGRVCFHPCETVCNRAEFDQAIAIRALERYLADNALTNHLKPHLENLPATGKKIAVAGAGPAGLAAAWFLSTLGYACEVFEAKSQAGGLLRWGIPSYRLHQDVLRAEIQRIKDRGVQIHCGQPFSLGAFQKAPQPFDAVFIACGHDRSIRMNIPGENLASDGLEFLYRIRNGQAADFQGTVAVIGGGNTAIDVARSLVRLGASVIIVYRRRKKDMPASRHEVDMALKEGVQLMELQAPIGIEEIQTEKVLTLQKMKISDTIIGLRPRAIPDGSTTRSLGVDHVFTAIGAQAGDHDVLAPQKNEGVLHLSHCTATIKDKLPIVWGGDLTNQTRSVADAIASGKQAAMALDTYFRQGWETIEERLAACRVGDTMALSMEIYRNGERKHRNSQIVSYADINTDYFQKATRTALPSMRTSESVRSFAEIEGTLSTENALAESGRCFNCGVCNQCDNCRIFCPEVAVNLQNSRRNIDLDYCKGCGICVVECPRHAMAFEEEKK